MAIFLEKISTLKSLAITGMTKNAGKTECLNYVLRELHRRGVKAGVTSIGVDGETVDSVSRTHKPEITLYPGMLFATSEAFYRQRRLTSEVVGLEERSTSLGRVVEAKVACKGRAIISGPPDTASLKKVIAKLRKNGANTVIVDGALSRLSLGAPSVTEAMILATGAALSPSIKEIVDKTAYVCKLIKLPQLDFPIDAQIEKTQKGVWSIADHGNSVNLNIPTGLRIRHHKDRIVDALKENSKYVYVGGAITDNILDFFRQIPQSKGMTLVVRDFSCVFASQMSCALFESSGRKLKVIRRPHLLGLSVNPTSPQGYKVDSRLLREELEERTGMEVIDVFNISN